MLVHEQKNVSAAILQLLFNFITSVVLVIVTRPPVCKHFAELLVFVVCMS